MTKNRSEVAASLLLGLFALPLASAAATFSTDFESPIFAEAPDLYAKDHSLLRHSDGVYHLFYAVGHAGESWNLPGNEIEIGHAASNDLIHWTILPRVLSIDPVHEWKSRNVWAPHVLRADVQIGNDVWPFLMSYTGVDSSRNQQIGIAVSADLANWTDLSVNSSAFRPNSEWAMWDPDSTWQNCRDSFVFHHNDQLVMLTSVLTRPGYQGLGTRGAIAMATSKDGLDWIEQGSPLVINDHWTLLASSYLVENPVSGLWHLFYSRPVNPGGIHILTSSTFDQDWDISNSTLIDPSSITSEIYGDFYSHAVNFITQAGLESRALRFDSIAWGKNGPSAPSINPFEQQWALVEGALGTMPTFRDRPAARSGQASNMDGLFWVNTAEGDSGPYGTGCPTCLPNEQLTGVLRSDPFQINHQTLRLWVGGSASPDTYVALVDQATGAELRAARGFGSDVMTMREWDLSDLFGDYVYFEIIDRDDAGHVSVDRIEAIGEVIGLSGIPPTPILTSASVSPNPTSGPAVMTYDLGSEAEVSLAIYGSGGRLVRRVAGGTQAAARRHQILWDGLLVGGAPAPAGVYFFRLEVGRDGGTANTVRRLTLVR